MIGTGTKLLVGGGAAAILGWLLLGSSGAATVTPPTGGGGLTPAQKGDADGCARGTADAKAGKSPATAAADLSPGGKDNAAWEAAMVASGDRAAYFAAYALAHERCYLAAAPVRTSTTYILRSGDDPVSVAKTYGISIDDLAAANPTLTWGLTNQVVSAFSNAVKGSRILGTASPQIDVEGTDNVVAIFNPTRGIVASGFPVYASSVPVKGAGNPYVYFPGGKGGQPYAAGGGNPGQGRVFVVGGTWRFVKEWVPGQAIVIPAKVATSGVVASVGGWLSKLGGVSVAGRTLVGAPRPGMALGSPYAQIPALTLHARVNGCASARVPANSERDEPTPLPFGGYTTRRRWMVMLCAWQETKRAALPEGRIVDSRWPGNIPEALPNLIVSSAQTREAGLGRRLSDSEFIDTAIVVAQSWSPDTTSAPVRYLASRVRTAGTDSGRRPTTHPLGWPAPPV